MTGFLAELGRKLTERWFTLLVLPGLAYLLAAVIAVRLDQSGWHDWRGLTDGFASLTAGEPDRRNVLAVRATLLVLAAIPVSAGVGALAQALGSPVEPALRGAWPPPFSGLAARRTTRRAADEAYERLRDPDQAARRNAVALIPPECPTWLGDRLRAPAVRVGQEYGIDLATVWPRLWLLLPAATRDILTDSRARLDAGFALGGWALLYVPLAVWWPAALIALAMAAIARHRTALAAEAYAELVESAVDLHLPRLLSRLAEPRPSPRQGQALTERLRRGM